MGLPALKPYSIRGGGSFLELQKKGLASANLGYIG